MITSVTHLWRLLKWGRTLARHGALRGIEEDPNTPAPVRRLARIARFGARIPDKPESAAALLEIGPAAIKLGQALSTRPDLVGERAAENLSLLQDDLPPAPFPLIKRTIDQSFGAPLETRALTGYQALRRPIGAAAVVLLLEHSVVQHPHRRGHLRDLALLTDALRECSDVERAALSSRLGGLRFEPESVSETLLRPSLR